jgi:hypothetical protein
MGIGSHGNIIATSAFTVILDLCRFLRNHLTWSSVFASYILTAGQCCDEVNPRLMMSTFTFANRTPGWALFRTRVQPILNLTSGSYLQHCC